MAKVKQTKEEAIKELSEDKEFKKVVTFGLNNRTRYYVNTGHYGLNKVVSGLWYGGWPSGRVNEVYGDPSAGKSLLMLSAMVSMQHGRIYVHPDEKMDLSMAYSVLDDSEKAYVREFCLSQGLDVDDILELQHDKTIEGHFDAAEIVIDKIRKSIGKNFPLAVFLDSISQLSTRHERKEGMQKKDMSKAGQVHKAMRLYSDYINDNDVMYLIASHVIANIGAMFGPQKVVKGGSGVAFQSSVRIDLHYKSKFIRNKKETDEGGEYGEVYGTKIVAKAAKNKITTPFQQTIMDIYFEQGIDPYSGLWDYFERQEMIYTVKEAKGGKNPEPAVFGIRDVEGSFTKDDFENIIIDKDILGVKESGQEYLTPITKKVVLEEEIELEGAASGDGVSIAPIPGTIAREAKVE